MEEVLRISAERAEFADLLRTHAGIDPHLALAEAGALDLADAHDALADRGAGLGALGAAEFVEGDGGGLDVEINAIEEWAGDALAVFFDLLRGAAALAFWIAVESARAGMRCLFAG